MAGAGGSTFAASMAMSSISSLATGYSQAQALKAAGAYQKSIADTNAAMANLAAGQVLEQGDIAASRKEMETEGRVGTEKAVQAAGGVDVNTGSNAAVRVGTDLAGKIDELTIRHNAQRQAWGYKTQAIQDTYQGQFAKMTAASQAQQTLLGAGLQAVASPLQMYAQRQYLSYRMGDRGNAGLPFDTSTSESAPLPPPMGLATTGNPLSLN